MGKKHDHIVHLKQNIQIPLIIGIIAAILTWSLFGLQTLLATVLSWVIGITIVATLIGAVAKSAPKN